VPAHQHTLIGNLSAHDGPGRRQRAGRGGLRHYQLSAAEAGPDRLLAIVREHWGQENGLHYRRDVTFHEDAGRTLDWTVAEALVVLNNLVLAILLRGGRLTLPKSVAFMPLTQIRP